MSMLSDLFKTKKTPSYGGIQPYGTLMDAAGGKEYYDRILGRSRGDSSGYGESYVSNANPQIAESHNNYTGYQLPELKSELSLTGRRAGSSGFQQIARSMSDQSDKENAIKARLAQAQAEVVHSDTNSGIDALGNFNKGDFDARKSLADFQQRGYGQESANIQSDRSRNDAAAANLLNYGQDTAGVLFGGQGAFQRQGSPTVNSGGVNYPTSQPPSGQQDYYKQMLARSVSGSAQGGKAPGVK